MFGTELRVGFMTSTLSQDFVEDIRDEDDNENKINLTDSTNNTEIELVASCTGQHQIIIVVKQKDAESSSKTSGELPFAAEASEYDIETEATATVVSYNKYHQKTKASKL
ncbi:unnamed protein product [Parnassius apollo]|uniref:(apollo) hypothetical protein n=1 Tax=Parnassius apollo TaxID=110799 RepID=A0A8S3WVL3_PARAO|nr:unnamed protein product [Parnassius apollo]